MIQSIRLKLMKYLFTLCFFTLFVTFQNSVSAQQTIDLSEDEKEAYLERILQNLKITL